MKVVVLTLLVCAVLAVSVTGAPHKRFLEFLSHLGNGDRGCPSKCIGDPCKRCTYPQGHGATCKKGKCCTAVWTDVAGHTISC
ncbi:hypothetical protein SNE40_012226 [Patella caerulea]|uniref:Uncharacterized protein n=1 Tax=Patella caerulea TaxID=87958 RepID=A0AAN8PQD2_PATCE